MPALIDSWMGDSNGDSPDGGSRRDRDARSLLFVGGLVVLAAILASWNASSVARRYSPANASARIDVNHAGAEELSELPGVGPALAQRILAARASGGRFADVADLISRVDGLGAQAAAALAARVAFGD
jgi:competence ComEA-like helix-hairpin-helix protein